jgi:carboxynorspermidine decarboxylase
MDIETIHIPTPCYVCDEAALESNLKILDSVQQRTGCRILLALKGFAMYSLFPLIRRYLYGVSASSLDEARLGAEAFGKEVHLCAPAYRDAEFSDLLGYCSHVIFNSTSQWDRFKPKALGSGNRVHCGLRINPEHSEVSPPVYDPCQPFSRLGITRENFPEQGLEGITGLHFHSLCERNADALERTLNAIEKNFGEIIPSMTWINLGGGHHITSADYNIELLCRLIRDINRRYSVDIYLEPGEAVALNAGVLVASVLDIIRNRMDIAIMDTSAAAHMPDVLEMPYRPEIKGAGKPGEFPYTYRLGGMTCLAGDILGDYSFPEKLEVGTKLIFQDMAHYTMVKNNTFNGVRLPSIAIRDNTGQVRLVREFGYEDYRSRLS